MRNVRPTHGCGESEDGASVPASSASPRSAPSAGMTSTSSSGGVQVALVFLAVFASFTSIGIVLPVLPVFLRRVMHASTDAVGLIMGIHAGVAIVGRPLSGHLITRHGPRVVLVAGAALLALGGVLYGLMPSLVGIATVRVVVGAGDACVMIAGAAWALALIPPARHGRALGLFGLSTWAGIAVGPVVGAALVSDWNAHLVWGASAAIALVGLVLAWSLPMPPAAPAPSERLSLVPRPVIRPGLSLAAGSAGYALLPTFIVLMLANNGHGHGAVVLACGAGAFIIARLCTGSLYAKLRPEVLAAGTAAVEAVGLLLIALSQHSRFPVAGAFAGAIMAGAGTSLLYPSLALVALRGVAHGDQASAIGAFTACWDLGIAVGASLLGLVIGRWGYDAGSVAAAGCAVVCVVLALRSAQLHTLQQSRRQSRPQSLASCQHGSSAVGASVTPTLRS